MRMKLNSACPHVLLTALVFLAMALSGMPPRNSGGPKSQSAAGERREKIEKLLVVIRDAKLRESDPGRVVEAIEELGHVKAVEAIDDLVKLLTFRRTWPWETPGSTMINEIHLVTPGGTYPAVGALMEIGQPSLPAMVRVMESHELSSLESQNAMEVVSYLFRGRRQAAVDYLKEAAGHSSSAKEAQRLTDAADKLPVR